MSEEEKKQQSTDTKAEDFKMDFSNFILSLNASAMIHLGDIPDPNTKERGVNLHSAKHTVDILELIQDKTRGNLTDEEKKLMDDVIYSLRMRYVQATTTPQKETDSAD